MKNQNQASYWICYILKTGLIVWMNVAGSIFRIYRSYLKHRITMFLTFNCNLNCFYCNIIRQPDFDRRWKTKNSTYDLNQFVQFIDSLSGQAIQHLHLTGGEVTLVNDLPDMIKYASELKIPCSITTNGTAPFPVYKKLIDNGLREIRVSIDTLDPVLFDQNVGKKGTFQKVIKTISGLVGLRDLENKQIYLILNVCVNKDEFASLPETIKKLIQLGPDDIKLIGISHDRAEINDSKNIFQLVREIENYINTVQRPYPLLHKKLKTIFSKDTYGIEDFASKALMNNCFVPLTEKTVDSKYYYPCPVYLREGGQPLGSLGKDDPEMQSEKIWAFVNGDSCLTDPICKASCIYCTKIYNNHMNASVHKRVRKISSRFEPITQAIRYEEEISLDTVVKTMAKTESIRATYNKDVLFQPFLVIKPNGIKYENKIFSFLKNQNVVVDGIKNISDWNQAGLKIYTSPATLWNVYRGLLFARVLPLLEGHSKARILILRDHCSFQTLKEIKYQIRKLLPPENYIIHHQDEVFATGPGFLHSPDMDSYWIEYTALLGTQICNLDFFRGPFLTNTNPDHFFSSRCHTSSNPF
ncbi:MAG: radical SAM protein [Desulfobacula sp.]|nr:radical SAM protein [Desulfobacula sp.]